MATTNGKNMNLAQLEETLDLYLVKKAPTLPDNIKEVIVKFAPWVNIIVLVISLPLVLALFGLGAIVAPFAMMSGGMMGAYSYGTTYTIAMIILAVQLVLQGMAIPGLFKQTKQSWNFLFYSSLVSAVYNLVQFNLGGLIIGTLLSLYLLFQVRSYYK